MVAPEVSPAECPLCGGSGWLIVPDGGAGTARRCECYKRGLGDALLSRTGLPDRYRGCRLANFDTRHPNAGIASQLKRALAECQRYVEEFVRPDGRTTSTGLIFTGPPGAGKTHLAAAVLIELVSTYRLAGRFADFTSLVHQIQSTFDPSSPESKREVLDPIMTVPLLVFDELGAQKPTEWVQDTLYLIINTRYNARRATFFTTNYRLEEPPSGKGQNLDRGADRGMGSEYLGRRIEARLVSRLCEMARAIPLDTVTDHRREVKMPANRTR